MDYQDFVTHFENPNDVPNEYFFERFRLWRNAELASSDWTQVADAPCDKQAWAAYRQALRDLPAQNADPKKIVFPIRPA